MITQRIEKRQHERGAESTAGCQDGKAGNFDSTPS